MFRALLDSADEYMLPKENVMGLVYSFLEGSNISSHYAARIEILLLDSKMPDSLAIMHN